MNEQAMTVEEQISASRVRAEAMRAELAALRARRAAYARATKTVKTLAR